ncbi:MAG: hypothetical protein JXX28_03860 [Deltaproteobacteria bacterium]|nr:hypothetical protein [Deltaproteobacteria bacterium]
MSLSKNVYAALTVGLLLGGCVKPAPPVAAPQPSPVALAAFRALPESTEVVAAPDRLTQALVEELRSRNLVPTQVSEVQPLFGGGRSSISRLEALAGEQRDAAWLVMVETEASYFAQVAGKYRWVVSAKISLVPVAAPDQGTGMEVDVPVFLQFSHQKGDAALAEATPTLRRRLGELLDEALAAPVSP